MKKFYLALVALMATFAVACNNCGSKCADEDKYVVILSLDAFRHDLPSFYNTPTLDSIANVGVYSKVMPCFPSNTFSNHYSMATGLHPDHHGIVNNSFYAKDLGLSYSIGNDEARVNPDFYKGEPIWHTVERQGLTAHVYTWVGVEAPYEGGFPTNYILYDVNRSRKELADSVLAALCNPNVEEIPNLTMWYFDEPDAVEHRYSPTSDETRVVMEDIDSILAYFMREVRKSPVYDKLNFIITGDHGMTELNPEKYYNIYPLIPGEAQHYFNANPLTLEPAADRVQAVYEILKAHEEEGHYEVWLRDEIPAEHHYGTFSERIYPIVLLPEIGWKVVYHEKEGWGTPRPKQSSHGFDPSEPDMQIAFYACGPAFKKGYTHDVTFRNLNDHLIITHILGIEPAPNNDCVWKDVKGLFRK
ncbi:MAG: alkaline phosphatase family protein [Tidjanibacter sp.]|nr:alkaline phosphatase family protein [Tidjanibacter sp.]